MSEPYLEAIRRGFQLAHEFGHRCGPVHLLVGVAEGDGPAAAALDPGQGRSLRAAVTADTEARGAVLGNSPYGGLGHLHMQAQGAAVALAESRGEPVSAEHLLIAGDGVVPPAPAAPRPHRRPQESHRRLGNVVR